MLTTLQGVLRALAAAVTPWLVLAPWEQGLRIRLGRHVHVLTPGFNWVLPGLDRVCVQTTRLRACQLQVQTLSTYNNRTLVLCASVSYAIADLRRLYDTLGHAEDTVKIIVAEAVARAVGGMVDPAPEHVVDAVQVGVAERLQAFGLGNVTVALTDYAFVRCYRLVSDQKWGGNGDVLSTAVQPLSQVPR